MRAVKQRAAASGRSLTEVIEGYLRQGLSLEAAPRRDFQLRFATVAGRVLPGVDLADRDALYERMEGRS